VLAVAGELAVDADQSGLVIDVGPGEAERFADPEAGVGEELEQQPVGACVFEQEGELVRFEDRTPFRRPVRLFGRFELADGIGGEPAAADGVAADLVQRHQRDHRRGGGERAFVCL
jgi:hypothetical protein